MTMPSIILAGDTTSYPHRTPCQYTLSTQPVNTPYQLTLYTMLRYPYTLSICSTNTPKYQHSLIHQPSLTSFSSIISLLQYFVSITSLQRC